MAFPLHHCHKSCRWLVAYRTTAVIVRRSHGTQSNKVKARVIEVCWRPDPTEMLRQHLKCNLTAPRRAGTSSGYFFLVLFTQPGFLFTQSEPGRLGTALSGPASRLVCAMTFSGYDPRQLSTAVHFQSVERRVQRNLEGLANVRLGELTVGRRHWLFFFLMLTRRRIRRGLGERGDKILHWRHSNCTHYDACIAEETQRECSQRHSELRARRLSGRFRLREAGSERIAPYRPTRSVRLESKRTLHGVFPDVYFYTQSLQRPHERRPMASGREQVSALFFVAWTQRRLTECFPWATKGSNPPKETLTFKKEFFWQTTSASLPAGLNFRHYLRNLIRVFD